MKTGEDRNLMIDLYKDMKNVCEEYSCSFCDMCPLGEFYKTSEEGKEGYNECQRQEREYDQSFDQNNYDEFVKIRRKLREN